MAGQSRTLKLSILGDIDQLKKSLTTGSTEVQGFGNKIGDFSKKAGLAFAAAGVAAAAYASKLLIDGVKSAIEDEAAQAKLATTLENVTGATRNQISAVEDYITKTALANGITDDKLRPSLDRLIRSTKSVEEAQKLQNLALDIAAGTGKDLSAVSEALGKAYDGNLGALKRLGVGIDDSIIKSKNFDAAAAALATTFEGQASKQAETFQGKMARLTVAFDEAKETVGSYVLDALTPLVSGIVTKGIPAVTDFAKNLGEALGPAFGQIVKVVRDDLLPILVTWWRFLYNEVIPAIASVVGPILMGLKNAFDTIRKAISDNSEELQPFYGFLKQVWEFIKNNLAPLLGGAFKTALEVIADIIAGLVTGFSRLVGFINSTLNALKAFVNFVANNPVSQFFFGGDNGSKGLKASTSFNSQGGGGGGITSQKDLFYDPNGDPRTFTGAPLELFSGGMQAAILKKNALVAETEALRKAREANAAARLVATGGLSTAERIVINVNAASVIDEEGFSRAVTDALNNSTFRGTNGASNLVGI
jgi:phage-related protein